MVSIVLAGLLAISVAANIYLYNLYFDLGRSLSSLESQNSRLSKQPIGSSSNLVINNGSEVPPHNSIQTSSPTLAATSFGNNSGTVRSITAVAVKTIQQDDGFFQSVSYVGTVMQIAADIRPGEGRILINTEVPTGVDFQSSAKTAVKVAEVVTGTQLSTKDVIFSITSEGNATDLQAVDGGSAGAAMTVLLVSEMEGKQINPKVLMTGTINDDGTIGQIGGVAEKAQAAGQYGAKIFLVPTGQAVYAAENCQESRQGPIVYRTCQSEQKSLSDLTESQFGMKVVEVGTIQQALSYFLS
jgi:uncharacterized protein